MKYLIKSWGLNEVRAFLERVLLDEGNSRGGGNREGAKRGEPKWIFLWPSQKTLTL
jgi:hypothetical protein